MATDATKALRQEWECAFNKLAELNQSLAAAPDADRDALERAIADQEADVLDTPAPSFSAVVTKLYLLWNGELEGLDPDSESKRLILEDLEGLIRQCAELLVMDAQDQPQPGWMTI